jgi:hypothetical protein
MDNNRMQTLLQNAAEREEKRQAEELIEAQTKVVSAAYDKAAAYTNLIILAAYAGFFGLWQLAREYITQEQALWAALSMLVSVAVFVLFEVWKMYLSSRSLLGLTRILTSPQNQKSIRRLVGEIEKHGSQERQRIVSLGYVWHVVLGLTVASGLLGVGVLGWALILGLLKP